MAGENQRRSAVSHPLLTSLPLPDAAITAADRVHQAGWYSGITIGNPATTFPLTTLALTADLLATPLNITAGLLTTSIVVTLDG